MEKHNKSNLVDKNNKQNWIFIKKREIYLKYISENYKYFIYNKWHILLFCHIQIFELVDVWIQSIKSEVRCFFQETPTSETPYEHKGLFSFHCLALMWQLPPPSSLPNLPPVKQPSKFVTACLHSMSLMQHLGSIGSGRQNRTEPALSASSVLIQQQSLSSTFFFSLFPWFKCTASVCKDCTCVVMCAPSPLEVNVVQAVQSYCTCICKSQGHLSRKIRKQCGCWNDLKHLNTSFKFLILQCWWFLLVVTATFSCWPGAVIIVIATQAASISA